MKILLYFSSVIMEDPFPRYKRSIYETGLRVPMLAKWIDDTSEVKINQLISFVDFAPTILDAANIEREFPFEGTSFQKKISENIFMLPQIVLMEHRYAQKYSRKNFKLIYNADTTSPIYKKVAYRQQMKTMQVLDSLNINQNLNAYFSELVF